MQETRNNCFGCCYILALVLTCYRLKKGRATFFRPETIVASFLHVTVFLPKVLFNHSKYCFGVKFSKWRFWSIYKIRVPKNTFLTVDLCVSVCICITQKLITAYASNLVFYICIIHRCYLKLFMKIGQNTGTIRILIHYGIWTDLLISSFSMFKLH